MMHWQLFDTPSEVAQYACRHILQVAQETISEKGQFHLVLAGGNTPKQTYLLLKESQAAWQHWHIYYGDERYLPITHPERNHIMASTSWLNHVTIPLQQIHAIPVHLELKQAAYQYSQVIQKALPFDMVLLGMGEDGHTASLFPNNRVTQENALVQAVFNAPKPPAERVTLSAKALSQTKHLLFLVTGKNKQAAISAWRRGKDLPVSHITAEKESIILIDEAAMSLA